MKHAIIIAVATVAVICGVCTGIVGGAMGMVAAATVIHAIADVNKTR